MISNTLKNLIYALNTGANIKPRDIVSALMGLQPLNKPLEVTFWVNSLFYRKLSDAEIAECNLFYNSNRKIFLELHRSGCSVKEAIDRVRSG